MLMESHKVHVPNHQPDHHHIPIVGLYPMKTTIHITINHYGNHMSILIVVNCDVFINEYIYIAYIYYVILTTISILGGSSHLVSGL
jgi:hypothetical protein